MIVKRSIRSKMLYKMFPLLKVKGQFSECLRTGIDKMGRDSPAKLLLKGIEVDKQAFEGRKVTVIKSKKNLADATVLFIHGGANVCQSTMFHWEFITDFARRTNATVFCPDYPRLPQYSGSAAYEFVLRFYRHILQNKSNGKIYILGDSSGAGLSLSLGIGLKMEDESLPDRIILLSPLLDANCNDPRQIELELDDPFLSVEDIKEVSKAFAGDLSLDDWRISPLFGDVNYLCPISIYTSDCDFLHSDALKLREKLEEVGADYTYHFEPKMVHDWMLFRLLPEGVKARTLIADELK